MDQIDLKIIRELKRDARQPVSKLATRVGLSKTPVLHRLRKLEKKGVITGYSARVDYTQLGLDHIAFVQVKLNDTRSPALTAFNAAVKKLVEVEQCHMTAAGFDYLLKVRTGNISQFRRVLGEAISTLPHVANTSTFMVMESVKD